MVGTLDGPYGFEIYELRHEKLDLTFRLVLSSSELFNVADQGLRPFRHFFWRSGGVGSRPEFSSRSRGHFGYDTKMMRYWARE